MHVYSAHQSTHKEFSAETHCVFYWTLVASISKNKHCSLHHEDSYVLQVSKNGPQENFEVCLTISVFTQACVQLFTLILFGVVVCILVCKYLGNKSYVASTIFITSRRSEGRPKTPIFTRAMQQFNYAYYGNMGCGVFKQGTQNQKDFCIKINLPKGNY